MGMKAAQDVVCLARLSYICRPAGERKSVRNLPAVVAFRLKNAFDCGIIPSRIGGSIALTAPGRHLK